MAKAYSTMHTVLKCGPDLDNLTKLCRIKSYPDLSGAVEVIESTDLGDRFTTSVAGVQSMETLVFVANYTPTAYDAVIAAQSKDEQFYQIEFGPNASQGKFYWKGVHFVRLLGGDVNSAREMEISVVPADALTQILYYLTDESGNPIVTDADKLVYVSHI